MLARLVILALLCSTTPVALAAVPTPTVEGPVTGGHGTPFVAATTFDLGAVGYMQEEFFISGTATAYTSATPLTSDGHWTVTPGDTAPYKTRILVYRPIRPGDFNGTVVVEWLNVSGGLDAAADWIGMHTELIREGCAWVGVSAQFVGVEPGESLLGIVPFPLKVVDPVRYGSLSHPGDSFSYDIFSQAGEAVRQALNTRILGAVRVRHVIAVGESQSAFRFVTYINGVHPLAHVYDGYLVHSRGGNGAPLAEAPQTAISVPTPAFTRDDLDVPVLTFETETDLTFLGYRAVQQPDGPRFRLWEVAGTAHADTYTVVVGMTDLGKSPDAAKLVVTSTPLPGVIECPLPINSGPQHFVLDAAVAALNRWVAGGASPAVAPRLQLNGATLARDAHGNVLGGIRTPEVDVPLARLTGQLQPGSILCALFGITSPFDAATLSALYPTPRSYVSAFNQATRRAVRAGFILDHDARLMKAAARSVF